jgi:4-aminobutyrate aminotransferase-like enzyme
VLGVYRPAAPLFVAGAGRRMIDSEGNSYLDFASGIGVNALGYGDAGLSDAFRSALERGLVHTSNLYRTAPAEALARELADRSFADRVFFCNSGAEANEAAFKLPMLAGTAGGSRNTDRGLRGAFTAACSVRSRRPTGRPCSSHSGVMPGVVSWPSTTLQPSTRPCPRPRPRRSSRNRCRGRAGSSR